MQHSIEHYTAQTGVPLLSKQLDLGAYVMTAYSICLMMDSRGMGSAILLM